MGWSIFNIVVLYWVENLILGVINILKMLTCRPDVSGMKDMLAEKLNSEEGSELSEEHREKWRAKIESGNVDRVVVNGRAALKLFMIPFFTLHYFGFCAGHGLFVFVFFGKESGLKGSMDLFGFTGAFGQIPALLAGGLLLATTGLVISHLVLAFQ